MIASPYAIVVAFVAGVLVGSFMNVLIYRLPRDENVAVGRSRCPGCGATIRWYDNIPVASYLLLKGKCRRCDFRIPLHYPTVEVASGVIAALVVVFMGPTLKALWMYVFFGTLLVITFIDWFHQIIPDPLSVGGVVFGWVGSLVCLDISLVESVVGSLVGGGLILGIALLYKALRKVDGMGGGDVKLMAMIGAFLGWQMVFPVLFIASFLGSIYGIALMRRKGGDTKTAVAFGSFLAPSATIVYVVGARLLELYLGR
jgi:leader peptidase (prepilin peptidase)/N-methyltransferase